LTPQEAQIARLAVAGRTNWHLRKIFAKLGISSRRELSPALRGR